MLKERKKSCWNQVSEWARGVRKRDQVEAEAWAILTAATDVVRRQWGSGGHLVKFSSGGSSFLCEVESQVICWEGASLRREEKYRVASQQSGAVHSDCLI